MTDLIPVQPQTPGHLNTETVNAWVAMAGLSTHTQRAYRRWIRTYLGLVNQVDDKKINLKALPIIMTVNSLMPAQLKGWLGHLKSKRMGKQSIMQAKASIVWLSQFMADMGHIEYEKPAGLSRVKAPRAETGQRAGTWLTQDEIKQLILATRQDMTKAPAMRARNTAIIVLMVTCGLRRDEVAGVQWCDIAKQGPYNVLRVHGKGEKLRTVKLPDMVIRAIDLWRPHHPYPEGDRPVFTRIWKGGTVTPYRLTDKAVWIAVQQAAKIAHLPKVSPHDLRRSFARGAFEAGVSFELIRQSLGHSNIATTERYVNSALELERAATDIWANLLDEGEA